MNIERIRKAIENLMVERGLAEEGEAIIIDKVANVITIKTSSREATFTEQELLNADPTVIEFISERLECSQKS